MNFLQDWNIVLTRKLEKHLENVDLHQAGNFTTYFWDITKYVFLNNSH